MDANGRLGSEQSEAVGGFAAEVQNQRGRIIPATFEEWFQGSVD